MHPIYDDPLVRSLLRSARAAWAVLEVTDGDQSMVANKLWEAIIKIEIEREKYDSPKTS